MTVAKFLAWLERWTARHPVRRPSAARRSAYVREVMARIESNPASSPSAAEWLSGWRWLAGSAAAVACALAVVVVWPRESSRMAQLLDRDWQLLTVVGETYAVAPELDDAQAQDDLLQFAEADAGTPDDSVTETLQLLQELEQAAGEAGDESTDELLEELQGLDELDMTT